MTAQTAPDAVREVIAQKLAGSGYLLEEMPEPIRLHYLRRADAILAALAAAGFTIAEPGCVAVSRDTLTRMYRDFDQRAIMGDDSTINREVREWIESILDPALSAGADQDAGRKRAM